MILAPLIHVLILRVSHLRGRRVALFKCRIDIKRIPLTAKKHKAAKPCAFSNALLKTSAK